MSRFGYSSDMPSFCGTFRRRCLAEYDLQHRITLSQRLLFVILVMSFANVNKSVPLTPDIVLPSSSASDSFENAVDSLLDEVPVKEYTEIMPIAEQSEQKSDLELDRSKLHPNRSFSMEKYDDERAIELTDDASDELENKWNENGAAELFDSDENEDELQPTDVEASPWKRRSVLGLDNLDFAASTLDLVRNHNNMLSASAAAAADSKTGPPAAPPGRVKVSSVTRPQAQHQLPGRLSLNLSQHDLRKMMQVYNAGRRRRKRQRTTRSR